MKIKVADRYDNCLGISYTGLEAKKQQYRQEIMNFLYGFSQVTKMESLLGKGLAVMDGKSVAPDLKVSLPASFSTHT